MLSGNVLSGNVCYPVMLTYFDPSVILKSHNRFLDMIIMGYV